MSTTISILGCGRTGTHASVLLLERFYGKVAIYDEDAQYAKGMTLDFMQAASVQSYYAYVQAVDNIEELKKSDIVIISEYRDETVPSIETIENLAKHVSVCIYACKDTSVLSKLTQKNIFGIHGMVDAAILKHAVSQEIDIAQKDIQVMLSGGVAHAMDSNPEFVRVCGIPVNEVKSGSYESALKKARESYNTFQEGPWDTYYLFASTSIEVALLVISGQGSIIPITLEKGTCPAFVDNNGYKEITL